MKTEDLDPWMQQRGFTVEQVEDGHNLLLDGFNEVHVAKGDPKEIFTAFCNGYHNGVNKGLRESIEIVRLMSQQEKKRLEELKGSIQP